MQALNNAQLEILKLFRYEQSAEELLELKQLLSEYIATKLISEINKEATEKGYTAEVIESWKDEHFRTPYNK